MQSPVLRRIVVDDSDPRVVYSSSFFADDTGSQDANGNFGPTFGSTLHGTNSSGSFYFPFSGTQMFVYGTISGDIKDPSWECFIDEINIHRTKPFNFTENNWLLCSYEGLTDGPHNLTVSVTSNGHTFWFDYLQYTPSANVPLEDAVILVDYKDPAIRYYSVWVENNVSMMTTTPGSGAVFNFIGVQLQWYSLIPTEASHAPSSATYSIDGGVNTGVALRGLPSPSSATQFNQLTFQTPKLPYGLHTINVTLQENSNSTPLALEYILVQNGTQTPGGNGTQSATPAPTGGSTSFSASATAKKSNIGSIVGGITGSFLFLISIIAAYLFFKHYNKKQANNPKVEDTIPIPFYPQPRPNLDMAEPVNTSSRRSFSQSANAPLSSPLQLDLLPSHRRRQSHGKQKYTTLPDASSSHATRERVEDIDENTPYYGGYQTWGQTKAIEAKSHKYKQRDSYI